MAIAAEWEWQDSKSVRPFTMPLMKLAATAIDQIATDRERVIVTLLKYFHTDSVCVRAPEPSSLADKQAEVWDPILDKVGAHIGVKPSHSADIMGPSQPDKVVTAMRAYLDNLDDWQLASVDSLAGSARSLVIALAVIEGHLDIAAAIRAARLDEDFQVEEWGFVEGGHDVDIADMRVRMAGPSLFLRLLQFRHPRDQVTRRDI
eukprot:SM000028S10097  [mRNA]  locus=s28:335599:337116:- [translate_table: standard]